mgnify:CR=1 FL=1
MITICKECKREISSSARRCPHCGSYRWTTGRIGCAFFLVIPALLIILAILIANSK